MKAIVRVDSKGRVTIPLFIREQVGIEPESYVELTVTKEKEILLKPVTRSGEMLITVTINVTKIPEDIAKAIEIIKREGAQILELKCREKSDKFVCNLVVSIIDYSMIVHMKNEINKGGLEIISISSVERRIE